MLAAVALAALALSLLLAFASATAPRSDANDDVSRGTSAEARSNAQGPEAAAQTPVAAPAPRWPDLWSTIAGAGTGQPQMLRSLLAPWVFAVDVIALLGLAAVLIVRNGTRRRRRVPRWPR